MATTNEIAATVYSFPRPSPSDPAPVTFPFYTLTNVTINLFKDGSVLYDSFFFIGIYC